MFRNIALEVRKQCAVPIYEMTTIHTMSDENGFLTNNDHLFLETLLLEIRGRDNWSLFVRSHSLRPKL